MHCLKCGTEIESPDVFCPQCLTSMEDYPVSRETPVIIPPRPVYDPERRGKQPPKPEELLSQLLRRQRILARICAVLAVISVVLCGLLIYFGLGQSRPVIGQNYSTNLTTESGEIP